MARGRLGFTLIELILTVVILGILATIMTPRIGQLLQRSGARQAAGVVATDLEQAVSLAGRLRVPVRITCDCADGSLVFSNRNTGAVLQRRRIAGLQGGMYVQGLTFSVPTVDVYPHGVTSSPLTVTLATVAGTRQVTLSSAGFVRVVP